MHQAQIRTSAGSYDVLVGPGVCGSLDANISRLNGVRRIAIIADARVAELHLETLTASLSESPTVLLFPPGEASKTLAQAAQLYDGLAAAQMERGDLIVTFGGGVAGDLGGFVAATWLRGVRYIQVPTTVEAAVDASVGGKTAVNHPIGKNLIGAFHPPSAVVIDTDFLATLPQRDFVAGLAESVKHAVIRDAAFLAWHENNIGPIVARDSTASVELIARNVSIKAAVVEADEHEARLRQILNYGHTLGHAIEHVLDYELRHGECVALGMIAENEIAARRGLLERDVAARIEGVLAALGLPARLPRAVDLSKIVARTRHDKKVAGGAVTFVLLHALGEPVWVNDVRDEEIAAALTRITPGL